jgi:hypothetical protein
MNDKNGCTRAYEQRVIAAEELIKKISAAIKKDKKEQKKDNTNWGFVGSMGHYEDLLQEVADSMGIINGGN